MLSLAFELCTARRHTTRPRVCAAKLHKPAWRVAHALKAKLLYCEQADRDRHV